MLRYGRSHIWTVWRAQRHFQLSPTPLWPREADIECASCRAQVKAPVKKLKQSSSGASEWYGPGRPGYLGMPQTLNCISKHAWVQHMHACSVPNHVLATFFLDTKCALASKCVFQAH